MENNGEDMLKMFEQAMTLSKAFNGGGNGGGGEAGQGMDDMQKMAQAVQMFQLFKSFNGQAGETQSDSQPSKAQPPESPPPKTPVPKATAPKEAISRENISREGISTEAMSTGFMSKNQPENVTGYYDEAIHTPELNRIKAAVPYLEQKYRKRVGMFVKLLELQKLMEMYTLEAAGMGMGQADADWRRGMLRAIYPHMPPQKKHMIEFIIKIIDINEIMLKMKEVKVGNVN